MNDAPTGKTLLKPEPMTDWEALRAMSDAEIHSRVEDDPDAHGTDEAFWKDADVVMPRPKQVVTIRLDRDLLDWFKQQSGYQTRINAILRAYMKAHTTA
jgi:uncharacterized protein (DUF4415 family)